MGRKQTYPQIHWQFVRHKHTELPTHFIKPSKNLFKTTNYGIYLNKIVDNLCKCVEKHEDKSVLTLL